MPQPFRVRFDPARDSWAVLQGERWRFVVVLPLFAVLVAFAFVGAMAEYAADGLFDWSQTMKVRLVTRDGGFVRDGEIPPMTPPPEVITWGSRVFVHGLAHHPDAKNLTELPAQYIEGMAYPLEVMDRRTSTSSSTPCVTIPPAEPGFGS